MLIVHPDNPQPRLIKQAVEALRAGKVIAYPTDSCYALGCCIGMKQPMEVIGRIRQVDQKHNYTLVCSDLSQVSCYARLDNMDFKLIKTHTPGAYTFILEASREVPKRLLNAKRKTIGVRIPENKIALALVRELGEPIMSSTLQLPDDEFPLTDPYEIDDILGKQLGAVIDGGYCGLEPTSMIDLSGSEPQVLREGKGDIQWLT